MEPLWGEQSTRDFVWSWVDVLIASRCAAFFFLLGLVAGSCFDWIRQRRVSTRCSLWCTAQATLCPYHISVEACQGTSLPSGGRFPCVPLAQIQQLLVRDVALYDKSESGQSASFGKVKYDRRKKNEIGTIISRKLECDGADNSVCM